MITATDIKNIQALPPDDQTLIFSLVESILKSNNNQTDAQKWFNSTRSRMVENNPLTMEEIDRIIHEED